MRLCYFFIFLFFLNNVHAFGVSPAEFNFQLKNGDFIEKIFIIVNNENDDKLFNVSSNSLLNFSSFLVEVEGSSKKEVEFSAAVPYETTAGNYEGRIYVNEIKDYGDGLNIVSLIGIKLSFNVLSDYLYEADSEKQDVLEDNIHNDIVFDEITFDETDNSDFDEIIKDRYVLLFFALVSFVIVLIFSFVVIKVIFKREKLL